MNFRQSIDFFRLTQGRLKSAEAYMRFQEFQGKLLVEYFHKQKTPLENQTILDLGCGYGGYSTALHHENTAVYSLDLEIEVKNLMTPYVCADASATPFPNQFFDLIVCASLIEHVKDPAALIAEILRLLKPGGRCYLSFPPFYTPIGGHQFSPYHLLGEKAALWAARKKGLYTNRDWLIDKYPTDVLSYETAYGPWGLYPRTIHGMRQLLSDFPIQIIDQSTRWMSLNFSRIPVLGEFMTWHVQFLFVKE